MAKTNAVVSIPLREREKQNKARRIRQAAEELFSEKSFMDVTTRELAERAGVGEATLFRYMTNKTELLLAVYGDRMETVVSQIEAKDAQLASTLDRGDPSAYLRRVYTIYRARCEFYRQDPVNTALYLREGFHAGNPLSGRVIALGDRVIRLAASVLQEGQDAQVLLGGVDARLAAQNCQSIYTHEIDRTPVRGFSPETIWDRVHARLAVQLEPLRITPN